MRLKPQSRIQPTLPEWSRRHFLKLLAASAGTMLTGGSGCGDNDNGLPTSGGVRKVVVVGAGFAGLTVAQSLRALGIPAVVVEARNRIGGRMWTQNVGGVPVDLGAAWIHGPDGNPVACFATSQGIGWKEAEVISGNLSVFDPHNGFLPGQFLFDLADLTSRFEAAVPELSRALPNASFADGAMRFLDEEGLSGDRRRYADFALRQGVAELFYGGPAAEMSLASTYDDSEFAGGNQFPDGGYTRLVDAMAVGLDIRLNSAVTAIQQDSGGVRVVTADQTYEASHAVVTIPLGVLKAEHIGFNPPLPARKLEAIRRLDMGNFEKVVLRFDNAFWLTKRRPQVAYVSDTYGEFPIYFDLTRYLGEPTLLCFCGGAFARAAAALDDNTVVTRIRSILGEMFQIEVPAPRHMARTRWYTDPYALGSYSFIPVGASADDMVALSEPAGRLLFAGEATDPLHYGSVPAAMISGLREAHRLRELAGIALPASLPPVLQCAPMSLSF